ncbi:MAG: M20 family peptidase [Lysobacterales bacterium]
MKKIIATAFVAVLVVAAISVYRAENTFLNLQLPPADSFTGIKFDEAQALQNFSDALKIPTVSHDDRRNFDAQAFLDFHAFLETAYPLVHRHAERSVINGYSLVYRLPGSNPALEPVLFMSHVDVVPVDDATRDEWTHPPFSGTVANEIIWGRGAIDDKIGVIALMEALELLLSENMTPERDIYLSFGHDEEVGGRDGAARIAEYFAAQGIRFDYVLDEGGVIAVGLIKAVDRPVAVIGVAEKGWVNIVLTVNTPGGHSSAPPDETGLGILSRAIVKLEDNPFPADLSLMNQHFEFIGAHASFTTRLFIANQWLFAPLVKKMLLAAPSTAASVRTTAAATMMSGSPKANILPTQARAVVNFRILPGETADSVKQRVIRIIDDERVTVSAEDGINPSPASPVDSRGFELIATTIRSLDEEALVAPYLMQGGTDAKHFYDLSDNIYRFLMLRATAETLTYIHGIDEQVPVEDYLQVIRFYYHLIRQSMAA